ncbi:radical SAM protein [Candidatus Daviesbacteria bacterium]|nr:radical SAM protein [Candidatus Daviesbacteria bacterium]
MGETLAKLYLDPKLYSSEDIFSPPAERRPHVIRFELTTGCNWKRCTYCTGYEGIPYREKSLAEYQDHVDEVFNRLDAPSVLSRIFIGGGDALAVETDKLNKAIKYTSSAYSSRAYHFGKKPPRRIAVYGSTRSINKQGINGLSDLNFLTGAGGELDLIYWGVESGSSEVLKYVRKGCLKEDILSAAEKLNIVDLQTSVMIMPGLGGMKFYDQHVSDTAEVLRDIQPRFLTFMGVNAAKNSVYAQKMNQEVAEGTNRPLTDRELVEQIADILDLAMFIKTTKVGYFGPDIDQVSHNPNPFGSIPIGLNGYRQERVVNYIRDQAKKLQERKQRPRYFILWF